MIKNLVPDYFYEILNKTPLDKINEIRLRVNKKAVVVIGNKSYYLSTSGLTGNYDKAYKVEKELIDEIVKRGCENSVYAFNYQIKNAFITVLGGIRIGITGEAVYEQDKLKTLKNINGLVIRFPHEVKGCSQVIMPYLFKHDFLNTLIVAPPGAGKTTIIRDIICEMSQRGYCYNVLLCDERFEIANCFNGSPTLDVGNFCDILSGTTKSYSFENGIRSLRPDIIVTDEISNVADYNSILYASTCGVKVLASIHAKNIEDLKSKSGFEILLKNKVFTRIVILSAKEGPGTVEAIYDENLRYVTL